MNLFARRQITGLLLAVILPVTLLQASLPADARAPGRGDSSRTEEALLDRPAQGSNAIDALGDRLQEAARRSGMAAAELSDDLSNDDSLWVDEFGRAYYVDPIPVADNRDEAPSRAGAESANAPFAYSQTFLLHSNPGADRVIYLDFDGHDASGTAWSSGTLITKAYDSDGNASSFSNAEMDVIQSVWQRVAEDFAAFDVDVTTEDPGYAAINRTGGGDQSYGTRLVVADDNMNTMCGGGCGGVAYVGTYNVTSNHDRYQPAWVFTQGVGHGAHNIAEAASHEVGHNLGLSHDGNSSTGYYGGHNGWAPIMGVGYYQPITQWSKGEYSGANQTQDDFVVMQNNGAPLHSDDHGDSAGAATSLVGPTLAGAGIISTRSDVDAFSFAAEAGAATINVDPASVSPNLDISIELRNSSGDLVASDDPTSVRVNGDIASGMNASITMSLPSADTYTLLVDGVGRGTASNGYTDYASLGRYTVSGSVTLTPPNEPPTAVAGADTTNGEAPLAVSFTSAGSSDGDGSIVNRSWDFGDGNTSTATNPSHTYNAPGSYTATLTVTDDDGATDTDTVAITAEAPNQPPAAVATPGSASGDAPLTVNFGSAGSTDSDGTIASRSWNFGDGATSTATNPSHTYTAPGSYTATLTVTDDDGATDTDTVAITVNEPPNQAPTAVASPESASGEGPLTVNFSSAGSVDADGTIVSRSWSFGDGTTSTAANPSHTYNDVGSYTATLTVTDNEGATGTDTVPVTVEPPNQSPTANATSDVTSGHAPLSVSFNSDASEDPDGTIDSYHWSFGDGGTSTNRNPSHTYVSAGTHTATLTVTDNDGATDTDSITITVQVPNQAPSAVATSSSTTGEAPHSVTFNSSGSSDSDGVITSRSWAFGDGGSSTATNPSHTYSNAGTFTATLTVTDDDGATDTDTITITVQPPNQAPTADAAADTTTGHAPLAVAFNSAGSSDTDGTIQSRSWAFGDGGSSTATNPSHTYSNAGTFTATLTVTDDDGATDTDTITITVQPPNQAPTADAAADTTTGHAPLAVAFNSAGSSDTDGTIQSRSWAFGDGGTSTATNPSHTYTSQGVYMATVTVTDDDGATDTDTIKITVSPPNQSPTANATASSTSGEAPHAVNFSSTGSGDADGAIVAYHWSFGDGATATSANPSHTYTSAGTHTATLTVTDDDGATASDSITITTTLPPCTTFWCRVLRQLGLG